MLPVLVCIFFMRNVHYDKRSHAKYLYAKDVTPVLLKIRLKSFKKLIKKILQTPFNGFTEITSKTCRVYTRQE